MQELADVLDHMDETQIDALVNLIANARKVFFVGVGRVELALEAIAKRLAHLGVDTVMVGQITEPAICGQDLLIVGSGSGKTGFPLFIAGKAKSFGAKVARIGIVEDCPMKQYTDLFVHDQPVRAVVAAGRRRHRHVHGAQTRYRPRFPVGVPRESGVEKRRYCCFRGCGFVVEPLWE